jgi:AraC-like DNA-binding protein
MRLGEEIPVSSQLDVVDRALSEKLGELTACSAAALLHISPGHFSRLFRKANGKTFRATRLERKLLLGAAMLTRTSLRISEIADELNYSQAGKFTTAFTRRFGISPTEFRKRNAPHDQMRA